MGKTDNDKREDFAGAYAPDRALREHLNARKLAPPARVQHRELPLAARATGAAGS